MKSITDMTWKDSALIDLKVLRENIDMALEQGLPFKRETMRHRFNRIIEQVENIREAKDETLTPEVLARAAVKPVKPRKRLKAVK